ncbi:phage baseplate protein [Stenotrophomonas sp. TWI143]|uniref:phage baseplate protein n=1 Tax=Stenotrophomonas sp. TWI143 TaxID=3136771 RepID=UPI00320A810A
MALTALTFSSVFGTRAAVGALELDALISEDTVLDSYATVYPVEDGSTITDNVSNDAEKLSLSGMVTSAQITVFGANGWQKLVQAKDVLRRLHEARELVTISTGMDTYTEMVMERCRIGRTNEGDHFSIDCDFRKIVKAQLKTETVPEDKAAPRAKGKAGSTRTSAGKASTEDLDERRRQEATRYVDEGLKLGRDGVSPGVI